MNQRGAALPTVLALVAAVLVIGLAMGSLSTLSLQFNRRQLDGIRAEMAARSAIAHLIAELREHEEGKKLDVLKPEPAGVAEAFPSGLVLQEGNYKVTIHFEQGLEGYSTDNLPGDAPAVGWSDKDDVPRIPPFTLDVVLNLEGPSGKQKYRAGLAKVWPYALYTNRGPIVLMGQPTLSDASANPSNVKGDVYTSWQGDLAAGGTDTNAGYGLEPVNSPSRLLAHMEARSGVQPMKRPDYPLILGMPFGTNPEFRPTDVLSESSTTDRYFMYTSSGMPPYGSNVQPDSFRPPPPERTNGGNSLDGDFFYFHDKIEIEPRVVGDGTKADEGIAPPSEKNTFTGKSRKRRVLERDPLLDIREGADSPISSFPTFKEYTLQPPGNELETKYGLFLDPDPSMLHKDEKGGKVPYFLTEDLVLTGETPGGPHFAIKGSVSNRQVLYYEGSKAKGSGIYVREKRAGMRLEGVVLHVEGDLDLGATSFDDLGTEKIPIVGAGATLIVDGKLILGNASINAEDQGFVIYAKDIVLKGGGNFFGLMIAQNSISILSQDDDPLNIQGALLCGGVGGITLRGARLEHNSRYLKSINGGGDFVVQSWNKLP